mgnify:CR=1 FL=1
MDEQKNDDRKAKVAALIPLFVIGTMLNTLGIVFVSLGWARYVMMGAGLLLMLLFVIRVVQLRPNGKHERL